ncbi:hypothetical protein BD770DRAFT_318236 [Pilaira anomala]|nr:hypothetical protein BD770DRAFT_318236 [Pilaira anomala]
MLPLIVFYLTAAWTFQIVSAHFELTYPPSRGYDEARESIAPCGGFNTVGQNRTLVPLNDSFVQINSDHTSYTYIVNVLRNANPTVPDFTGSDLYTVAYGARDYPEDSCIAFDVSNTTEFANGTSATIQIVFNGGDGVLYQVKKKNYS